MAGHGDPISVLPVAGPLTGAELLVTVQDGETRQFAVIRLLNPPPPAGAISGARAASGSPLDVSSSIEMPIPFADVTYDTDGYYLGFDGVMTVPVAGIYNCAAYFILSGSDVGSFCSVQLRDAGGVVVAAVVLQAAGLVTSPGQSLAGQISLSGGGTVTMFITCNGTDAQLDGAFAISPAGSLATPPAPVRHSLLYGAGADGEALVTAPLADSETFTVAGWINLDSLPAGADENWMSRGDDVGDGGWSLAMNVRGDGTLTAECVMTIPAPVGLGVASAAPIATGGWHHVAAVFRAAVSIDLYIDGTLSNSASITQSGFRGIGTHTKFGGLFNGFSPPIHGRLCDPAVWNRALDPTDIAALATGSTHPDAFASGLLAYYPVFESGGATLANAVSGGSPATLSGDVAVNSLLPPGF